MPEEHEETPGGEAPGNEAPGNETPGDEQPGNEAPADDDAGGLKPKDGTPGLMADVLKGEPEKGDAPKDASKAFALPDGFEVPKHLEGKTPEETLGNLLSGYKKLRDQKGNAPETPDGYELTLPEEVSAKLGMAKNDPVFDAFKSVMHENGVSNDVMNGVLGGFVEMLDKQGLIPEAFDEEAFLTAEWEKLGGREKGMAQVKVLTDWAEGLGKQGVLTQEELEEFPFLAGTAQGVSILAKLRELTGEKPIPTDLVVNKSGLTKSELDDLINDPKYGEDEVYTAEVDAKFEAAYGKG